VWNNTTREASLHWWLGKLDQDYIWAGNEVADGGFDCSGLINGALRKFGVTSSDLRARDLAARFPVVAPNDLQPGDLLFWLRGGTINHVEAVYAILDDTVYTIGASGGGSSTTTEAAAKARDARVKVKVAEDNWVKAVNPFGDSPS